MYGSNNPVLQHFGADELAAQARRQAASDRRQRGEYVPPSEDVARPRPMSFQFDRPVASGLARGTRDLLVEEASGGSVQPQYTGSPSYDSSSPGPSSYVADPNSPASSPPPASYDSSQEAAYQAQGPASGDSRSGSGSRGRSQERYYNLTTDAQRRAYGDYHSQGGSPGSSQERLRSSPSGTPPDRSARPRGPPIQQPPFLAGVPGPPRAPTPGAARGTGGRRRTASTSPGASRSVSPSQPTSDDAAMVAPRGIAARISSRPATAAAARRSTPATPRGGRAAAAPAVPAWAPVAGIEHMRLDEMDEDARVAHMLNDPSARTPGSGAAPPAGQPPRASPPQPAQPAPTGSPQYVAGAHGGSPTQQPGTWNPSGYGETGRSSDISNSYYPKWRLRKHLEPEVPAHRFVQPRSQGLHAPLPLSTYSFDEAHPAMAEQHYARSPAQDAVLQAERRKMQQAKMRASRTEARSRTTSPMPTSGQLAADVNRLARVREAGRTRLRQLEEEGETLKLQTRQVQQRAMDAISRSAHISAAVDRSRSPSASATPRHSRTPSPSAYYGYSRPGPIRGEYISAALDRSRSPSASPTPRRSRTPSPSAYHGYGGGSRGGGYFGSPPSLSPGRFRRPASASPAYGAAAAQHDGGQYGPLYPPDEEDEEGVYYDDDGAPEVAYAHGAGAGYAHGGQYRPVSAPPGQPAPVSPPPPPRPSEAQQILDMINQADRLPQHEQMLHERGRRGQGAAASPDPLVRASAVAGARKPLGLMDGDEQRIAVGAYDRSRYEEYQRQVDLEMQRRAVEGGYDSDRERDEAAGLLVRDPNEPLPLTEEEQRAAAQAAWQQENDWMDEYRQRFGPEDGYGPSPRGSRGGGVGPHGSPSQLHAQRSALSEGEEEMLQRPFVPIVSPEMPMSAGYASEGPDGRTRQWHAMRRLFGRSTTVPQPFGFEERDMARPKSIARVKLEQDLAIRRAEEQAARNTRFRASPVPVSVAEPRYERLLLEAEVKRQLNQQQRLEEMASMIEQPFSFYYRDQEREAAREALARAAKDPARFQVAFRARDMPQHTKQERFKALMIQMEARRDTTKRRVDEARRAVQERVQAQAARRQEAANSAYQYRLKSVDPAVHSLPHPTKPPGATPDFDTIHRQHELQMARARAHIRKRITVPQEFTLNGSSRAEQAARAQKAEERRHRIILDMQVDSELLPEMRWPHKSPRGKVRPTPIPAFLVKYMSQPPGNRAANARQSSTAVAVREGAFMTRAEREAIQRRATEKLRAQSLRQADRLLAAAERRKQEAIDLARAARGPADSGVDAMAGGDDFSSNARGAASRRRAAVSGREDNPAAYVEARHEQIERRVREVVEDTLLDAGIAAYRYVEGTGAGGRSPGQQAEE